MITRDIQVIDGKVSRKHAVVRMGDAGHMISSTQSKNGLLITGEEIAEETRLADGDEVMLGDTVLRYRVDSGGDYTNAVHHRKVADRDARDANTMM
jgi:pSer/pThr/pTyr-binding forkhead associated (FHA) protein